MIELHERTVAAPTLDTRTQRAGVHLVADLRECELSAFAPDDDSVGAIKGAVSAVLAAYRFSELGSYYHFFGPGAVTATVCLAESHLSFHSWPEERYVSFDLFACASVRPCPEGAETLIAGGAAPLPTLGTGRANGAGARTAPGVIPFDGADRKQLILERCEARVRSVLHELSLSMFHPGSATIQALYR